MFYTDDGTNPWHILDEGQTKDLLEAVRCEQYAALFNGSNYEIDAQDLLFYDGYYIACLNNKDRFPAFVMYYVTNFEDHYYLDGTDNVINLLNERKALTLNEDNILDYLAFYFSASFDPERKIALIDDPHRTPYSGSSAMSHHFKALNLFDNHKVEFDPVSKSYEIHIPVLYNGETVMAEMWVLPDGTISVLEPLELVFPNNVPEDKNPLNYTHPHAEEILASNKEILNKSAEGKRLLTFAEEYQINPRIITGMTYGGWTQDPNLISFMAPATISEYNPYQLLDIAKTIKDIELSYLGASTTTLQDNEVKYYETNNARNLEIILTTCKIAEELDNQGIPDVLERLRKLGFDHIYRAYKSKESDEELVNAYLLTVEKFAERITQDGS